VTEMQHSKSLADNHLGESNEQRDALQNALQIHDRFLPALFGLAHLD
jgi:hypothetical protein